MPRDKTFYALSMPILALKDKNIRRYYVYKDPDDYVEVEADTAQQAMQESGVDTPYKVVHVLFDLSKLIEDGILERVGMHPMAEDIPEATAEEDIPTVEEDMVSEVSQKEENKEKGAVEEGISN